jgi:CBS domain containing-hemolysin-like protein
LAVPIVIASIVVLLAIKAIISAEEAAASHITRGSRPAPRRVRAQRRLRARTALRPARASACRRRDGLGGRLHGCAALSAIAVLLAYEAWPDWLAAIAGAGIGLIVFFALGEALPRTLAAQNPEGVALAFAPLAAPWCRCSIRLPACSMPRGEWIMRLAVGEELPTRPGQEMPSCVRTAPPTKRRDREESEEALLEAVSEFGEKVVREVMVPRTDMTCLPDTASAADAIELIESLGYSRLPVYPRDGRRHPRSALREGPACCHRARMPT